jgi:hypothetical protein
LREYGACIRASWPVASDSDIENKEEIIVEGIRSSTSLSGGVLKELFIIEEPFDAVLFPDDGKYVKFFRKFSASGQGLGATYKLVLCGVVAKVDGTMNPSRLAADDFHDINFSAGRPTDLGDIAAEHPEGWPQALAFGQECPYINSAKFEVLFSAGNDA